MRRPSSAVVIALLALVVALSSTANAAGVITGRNVKDGSLTGADVQNGSLGSRDELKFSGRLGGKDLVPGRYKLSLHLGRRTPASLVVSVLKMKKR